jgi:hypothetical protein
LWPHPAGGPGHPPVPHDRVPGAWRRAVTFPNTENRDDVAVDPWVGYVDAGGKQLAKFLARRLRRGAAPALGDVYAARDLGMADGATLHAPRGISATNGLRFDYRVFNPATPAGPAVGKFVVLYKEGGVAAWAKSAEVTGVVDPIATTATANYQVPAGTKHVALAVWPNNEAEIPEDVAAETYIFAKLNTVLEVRFDTDKLVVGALGARQAIYDAGMVVRVEGGHVGNDYPHTLIRVGAERHLGLLFDETLVVDAERRAVEVWDSGLTERRYRAPRSVRVERWVLPAGETAGVATTDAEWMRVRPKVSALQNGAFASGIAPWAEVIDSGLTTTWDHDAGIGALVAGSLKATVTANDATLAAYSAAESEFIAVVPGSLHTVAAWTRTESSDLIPLLYVAFYADDDAGAGTGVLIEPTWVPVPAHFYRRVVTATIPSGTTHIRVGARVQNRRAFAATGSVWFDDVGIDNTEIFLGESAAGAFDVTLAWFPSYL